MQNKLENFCDQEQGDRSMRGRQMAEIDVEIDGNADGDDDGQLSSGEASVDKPMKQRARRRFLRLTSKRCVTNVDALLNNSIK